MFKGMNQLSPEDHFEEQNVAQQVKKFTAYYVAHRFIGVFTRAHHLSVSWAILMKSILHSLFIKDSF
jgi:hypothetical protein